MTDKEQIMINGVDVSKCEYIGIANYCSCRKEKQMFCEDNPNCYFKQLQKEKFENLNNRQMVKNAENLIYENSELYKSLKEKEQECEELEEKMAEVTYRATGGRLSYSNYTLDAIEQAFNDQLEILSDKKVKEETKELKKECEELKAYAQRQKNQRETYYKEFLKKDKALEEIGEIVSKDYYGDTWADISIKLDNIRNIINKAKGEGND